MESVHTNVMVRCVYFLGPDNVLNRNSLSNLAIPFRYQNIMLTQPW